MRFFFAWFLQWCTKMYVRRHRPFVIGITGSIGKTSCRMILTQTLRELLPELTISTSPKNFNSEIGLPLAVLEIEKYEPTLLQTIGVMFTVLVRALGRKRYDMVVLEYGIDGPGDMQLMTSLVQPHIAIFTGLDKVHAHQLGGPDEILAEKSHLLYASKEMVFYPIDGVYLGPYLSMVEVDKLSFSLHEDLAHDADIGYIGYRLDRNGDDVVTDIQLQQGVEHLGAIRSNLIGRSEAGYLSLGVEIAMILERRLGTHLSHHLDAPKSDVDLHFDLQPGRCTVYRGIHGSHLIDSSYNAAPQSMQHMIKTAIHMRQELFPDHQLVYCLGDMRELGDYTEREHRQLASHVAQSADAVFLVGESMNAYMQDELLKLGYNQKNIHTFQSSQLLGQQLCDYLDKEGPALVLFKGSQNTIFLEDAIPFVLEDEADIATLCRQSDRWKQRKATIMSDTLS